MHRDNISFVVCTKSDFVITSSCDGHVKFWKKNEEGIEFVKHFRAHLHPITSMNANMMGTLLCTSSTDKSVKIFDVINFDMINMLKLDYTPSNTCWVYKQADTISCLAVCDADSPKISIYDAQGTNTPIHVVDIHKKTISVIAFNAAFETVISVDTAGILEYWQTHKHNFAFPEKVVQFESKLDTSLYEFAKNKTIVTGLAVTSDGKKFATFSTDRKVRVFLFLTGKLIRVYDEALARFSEAQQTSHAIPNMDFSRRMNNEKDIEKTESLAYNNILFDLSDHFIIFSSMIGIKIINIETNKCVRILGKTDNIRPLHIAIFQGKIKKSNAAVTIEHEAAESTVMNQTISDPTIICSAFKKPRFYLYSRRMPSDVQEIDRDVFNEQPSKEDILAVTESNPVQKIFDNAIIHTTFGDIFMKLFGKECPKTVENFCVHGKNGYFNGHIFHRVIKGFMIQTGDPTASGTGGSSIWGHEFKDEFVSTLKHDRPYTVSMANAGPNTNASQFFITVCPCPWLDNKHTIFGRVYKGMEVVQNICGAKTNPKTDKPYDEIKIISITLN
jgi:peptidylprolyl isomerase domain and WD repeat-containing protein 1